jgi:hypothetical protein
VELDDNSAEAHNSLAFATFYWTWDAATAEREFKRVIELNPGYVAAHRWYATSLMVTRRYPEPMTNGIPTWFLRTATAHSMPSATILPFSTWWRDQASPRSD